MKSYADFRAIVIIYLLAACEARPPIPYCPLHNDLVVGITLLKGTSCGVPAALLLAESKGGAGGNYYQLDNGPLQEEAQFDGVRPGVHMITVMDKNYCKVSAGITILSGISFKDSVKPIFDTKCSQSGCHDGTSLSFLVFENIKRSAVDIKALVKTRVMPKPGSPPLSDDEIERIVCWVDDGAPDN